MSGRLSTIFAALLAAGVLGAPVAQADKNDLRTGVFIGTWCGYSAQYHIDTKEPDDWKFHGKLTFTRYPGVAEELWIEQYDDNSLRMIRYLSGDQAGATQVVQTLPPQPPPGGERDGAFYVSDFSNGVDCEGANKGSSFFVEAIAGPQKTDFKVNDAVEYRAAPDFGSAPLGVINKGNSVHVLERRNVLAKDWAHVEFRSERQTLNGWIEASFLPE